MNNKSENRKEIILYGMLIALGMVVKCSLLHVRTGDYVSFLEPWLRFIHANGYEHALRYKFYDYSPAYIYYLVIVAKVGINPLYAIKGLSIIFEYVTAFFIGKTAQLKTAKTSTVWISVALMPLLPSILLNSSYLSQCDSIYTAFVVMAVYYSLKERPLLSVLFLAISFVFKMQGVFILPYFFVMMLRKHIPFYHFFIIPLIYVASLLPTWYYGRPLCDTVLTYLEQTDRWRMLTMNFPNGYIFIDNVHYDLFKLLGMGVTFVFTLLFGWWCSRRKFVFTFDTWIHLAFLSVIVTPFLLPGMHERYLYMGDVFGLLYFLVWRKNGFAPLGIWLISFYSYTRMSRFNDILPQEPAFFIYTIIVIFVFQNFVRSIRKNESRFAQ